MLVLREYRVFVREAELYMYSPIQTTHTHTHNLHTADYHRSLPHIAALNPYPKSALFAWNSFSTAVDMSLSDTFRAEETNALSENPIACSHERTPDHRRIRGGS